MKKLLLLLIIVCIVSQTIAQTTRLEDLCQTFHLPDGKDTTTFIVFGTKEDLKIKKPLFIFRQGSQPMPIIQYEGDKYYVGSPFRFSEYKNDYHFVIVSKPGVRLVADSLFMKEYQQAMERPVA